MKTTQQSKVLFMAQAAMIAAIYVVLTMLAHLLHSEKCRSAFRKR